MRVGVIEIFWAQKHTHNNQQYSQRFRIILSVYAQFSVPKCLHTTIINIALRFNIFWSGGSETVDDSET